MLPPTPQPPDPSGPPSAPRSRARQWMVVALVLGFGYLAVSVIALSGAVASMTREPTATELEAAARAEVARRWKVWPAGRIFPRTLTYEIGGGDKETATRMGIARDTECGDAVDPAYATVLAKQRCRAVLRATYADALRGMVVTVGIVAFDDALAADRAWLSLPNPTSPDGRGPALRAAAFPGTAAARFTDSARLHRTTGRGGPYLLLTTAGYADGRPAAAVTKSRPGRPFAFVEQIAEGILTPLSTRTPPDCSSREWRC